jgi:hypothetical protein
MAKRQRNSKDDLTTIMWHLAQRELRHAVTLGHTFVQSGTTEEQYRLTIVGAWGSATVVACGCKAGNYYGYCWHRDTVNTLLDQAQAGS